MRRLPLAVGERAQRVAERPLALIRHLAHLGANQVHVVLQGRFELARHDGHSLIQDRGCNDYVTDR